MSSSETAPTPDRAPPRPLARRAPLAALVAAPWLLALSQVPGPIDVGPSWAAADDRAHSGSLYVRLANRGVLTDRLTAAHCPAFGHVELAGLDPATQGDKGAEQGVLLAPGSIVTLDAGGPHFVGTDATRPLQAGGLISCTLSFVRSGERIVVFGIGPEGRVTDEP